MAYPSDPGLPAKTIRGIDVIACRIQAAGGATGTRPSWAQCRPLIFIEFTPLREHRNVGLATRRAGCVSVERAPRGGLGSPLGASLVDAAHGYSDGLNGSWAHGWHGGARVVPECDCFVIHAVRATVGVVIIFRVLRLGLCRVVFRGRWSGSRGHRGSRWRCLPDAVGAQQARSSNAGAWRCWSARRAPGRG